MYANHTLTKVSKIQCGNSGQPVEGPGLEPRPRYVPSAEQQHDVELATVGARSFQDGGVCLLCSDPILKDERIVRRSSTSGEGWVHVRCEFALRA